jgi:Ran GTPase-activating protein (RanGAP) involved in mRNA processing and transport
LDLSSTKIGDGGAEFSKVVETNKTLTDLNLEHNNIGPTSCGILKAIEKNTTLVVLNFAWNNCGEDGGSILTTALKGNKTLTHLNLANNGIFSSETKYEIQDAWADRSQHLKL